MNNGFVKSKNRDERIDRFLDTLIWYFSEKSTPTGFYHNVGQIEEKLGQLIKVGETLNKNIEDAGESSEKLTSALNKITLAGVIIAGIGLLIALGNLLFEIYKYLNQ
jgi:hypothetical protein